MFVIKGKINTSIFCPMLKHEESPKKPQYNMATHLFLDTPPPPLCLTPPFLAEIFRPPPISINFEKVEPLPPNYESVTTKKTWRTWLIRAQNLLIL